MGEGDGEVDGGDDEVASTCCGAEFSLHVFGDEK